MGWHEYELTLAQKQAAKKLVARWRREGGMGDQPYFVVDEVGCIHHANKEAVCLGHLVGKHIKNKPVLFQVVMTKQWCSAKDRDQKVQIEEEDIVRYLKATVNSDMCKPYIAKHTHKERMEIGIPVPLFDTPKNAPVLVSTHVRWCWDRHNNRRNKNIFYLKDNFNMTWKEAMFIGSCLIETPLDEGEEDFRVKSYNDCHSPFGSSVTVAMARKYCQGRFPHTNMDPFMGETFRIGSGINELFFKDILHSPNFNGEIEVRLEKRFPVIKREWQGPAYPMNQFTPIIKYVLRYLRGGK